MPPIFLQIYQSKIISQTASNFNLFYFLKFQSFYSDIIIFTTKQQARNCMRKSASISKQNINYSIPRSYNDLTSPLTNFSSAKQKTFMKNSLKNNVLLKMQMYQNNSKPVNKSMNISQLRAASFIYKIPQFSSPQINFEVSQAIKLKVQQIKNDMVTHLPQIKSSNYNPKKLQNQFNHRSSILELQNWLKNKLRENPPLNAQESMQYKNMIMGVGMKQLIRIINKRCIQQGKMVEQVWELTWSICRQIILYLSKRAKKCQEVLQKELNFYEKNCKNNFSNVQIQLNEAKIKINSLQSQNIELKIQLEQIQEQNHKLLAENSTARVNQGNYHQEFLKILEQNLAIYLQIGDNSKRDWIKKMYIKISKAKNQIRQTMKQQINTTLINKIKQQKIVTDQGEEIVQVDQAGNLIFKGKQPKQNWNVQDQSQMALDLDNGCQFDEMKKQLQEEFKPIDMQTQTDLITRQQAQTQYQFLVQTCSIQVQTDSKQSLQMGVNTDQPNQNSNQKNGQNKQRKPKQSIIFNQKRQKTSKTIGKDKKPQRFNSTLISSNIEERQTQNIRPSHFILNNPSKVFTLTEQGEQSSKVQMIEYVCKQCMSHKSSFQVELQKSDEESNYFRQKGLRQLRSQFPNQQQSKKYLHGNRFNSLQKQDKPGQKRIYINQIQKNEIIPQVDQQNQQFGKDFSQYKKDSSSYMQDQSFNNLQQQGRSKQKSNSNSFHSNKGGHGNRYKKRRDSSMMHDVNYKKQMDIKQHSNFKENQNFQVCNEEDNFLKVKAKLSITQKQPYFKFFHDQIIESNKFHLQQIIFPQLNSDYILDKYFFLVQQINDLPQSKIMLNQKQMNAAIQKNLIPIIVELLGQVKKSIKNQTIEQTIRNFPSLPYTIMNKFSTKYGVKILAIKNMKILLSSLKKIQSYSEKYKLLRLMLFTDCKAYYSEDLFVYLMIISIMDPFIQIDKTINYEEINQLRLICQTHLTKQKKVYEQFNRLTKQELGKTKTHSTFSEVRLSPLVRSIFTNYRMMKINKIQELGFIFFMLRKDNHVDYNIFSFFISCLNMDISIKVKIAKIFLSNCDLKLKNNKMAISQSGYAKFLIRCSQFSFDYLKEIVAGQKQKIENTQKSRSISEDIFQESEFTKKNNQEFNKDNKNPIQTHPRISLPNIQNQIGCLMHQDTRLSTQKQILVTSRKSLLKPLESLQVSRQQIEVKAKEERLGNRKLSLLYRKRNRNEIPSKFREYSSFTFQIVRFLQNEQDSKFMTNEQKNFLQDYLHIHVISSQVEQVIGTVDYFSNQMLELVCMQRRQLLIIQKEANISTL